MDKEQMVKKSRKTVKVTADYQSVFNSPPGEEVLKDLIKTHSFLNSTFSGDVNQMLIREGERNVVLRILHLLKTDLNDIKERIDKYANEQ